MYIKSFIIVFALFFSFFTSQAREKSRPKSLGGDYLLELTLGVVDEGEEDIFEFGIEVERFLDKAEHHCAIGLVLEPGFSDEKKSTYMALSMSLYYYHYKAYLSSGLLSDFDDINEWKTRFGLGKEFFLARNYILVPALVVDNIRDEFNPGISIGLAHEF